MFLMLVIQISCLKKWKNRKKKSEDAEDEEEDYDGVTFCRNRSRLIKLEKSDDFYIVDVFVNSSILMQCKFW